MASNPAKLNLAEIEQAKEDQIEVIAGGIFEPEKLTEHFKGCDITISAIITSIASSTSTSSK
jgi:hypothetical protein